MRSLRPTITALAVLLLYSAAFAHSERPFADFGPLAGALPDVNRRSRTTLVVCKPSSNPTRAEHRDMRARLPASKAEDAAWHRNAKLFRRCRYEHIQAAVNAAGNDTTMLVMPGIYREEPSRAVPTSTRGDNPDGTYSYAHHLANPNDANLIGIIGRTNITLEGTGTSPRAVLVDVGFLKDVGIRADRADGIIIRNLWERDANEHGIYVVETSGYVFDRTVGSYNHEYQLFSFASDHGLYTDCEAEGGSDSGIYIGGHPDTHAENRFSAVIQRCKMHDNALGFSGTQGTSVQIIDSDAYDNAIGLSFDSEVDHPNFPQRYSVIEGNRIHDNNLDVYAADAGTPVGGPGYGFFRYPVGTGMWIVGGEHNVIRNNYIYDNGRFGIVLFFNPFEDPPGPVGPATARFNEVTQNFFGIDPTGTPVPNSTALPPGGDYARGGSDVFWDENGEGNCADGQATGSGPVTRDPVAYPACPNASPAPALPPDKLNLLLSCILEERPAGSGVYHTADTAYPCPWGQENFSGYLNRDQRECGNNAIDPGEDCDGGYGGGAAGETCESLGRGPDATRPLTCTADCMFDAAGCTAPTCGRIRAAGLSARDQPGGGRDGVTVMLDGLDGAGRAFDPVTEGISITLRDDTRLIHAGTTRSQLLYQGRVAGGPRWSSTPSRRRYADRGGTSDGVAKIDLTSTGAFGGPFKAVVRARNLDLPAGMLAARTGTIVLRIGDDCWSTTASCSPHGKTTGCRTTP